MDATALAGRQSLTQALYCPRDLRSLIVDVPPGGGVCAGANLVTGHQAHTGQEDCVCVYVFVYQHVCVYVNEHTLCVCIHCVYAYTHFMPS